MKYSEFIKLLQLNLNQKGEALKVDGEFGPKTQAALSKYDVSMFLTRVKLEPSIGEIKTPWMDEMKKHEGKSETDKKFQSFLVPFWSKSGLPNFKSLVGSMFAWCGLFVFAGLYLTGYETPINAFRAKSWDTFGQSIEYKINGFPRGSVVRINSKGDCQSSSGNHVTMANGDCSSDDLKKPGALFDGYGGNQGNQAKVSTYSVSKICAVRWPKELPLPSKISESKNCTKSSESKSESTR